MQKMFEEVTYGNPWYYWFRQGNDTRVFRVVRDHTGGLWVSQCGYSTRMNVWLLGHKCLGPVKPPVESSITSDKITMELEIIFPDGKE